MSSLLNRLRTSRAASLSAAGLVALAGILLVLLGVAKATVWAPERVTVARVAGQSGVPVVTTTAEATALDGPALKVDVRGPAGRPVFVGVGRADDVAAYLGGVARTEVTGVREDKPVSTLAIRLMSSSRTAGSHRAVPSISDLSQPKMPLLVNRAPPPSCRHLPVTVGRQVTACIAAAPPRPRVKP